MVLQAYGFFNEVIVEKCFGMLKMLGISPMTTTLKMNERYELRIHCMNFLEDIEILLGIVSLDDYLDVKQTLIENVSQVLGLYYANSLQGLTLMQLFVFIITTKKQTYRCAHDRRKMSTSTGKPHSTITRRCRGEFNANPKWNHQPKQIPQIVEWLRQNRFHCQLVHFFIGQISEPNVLGSDNVHKTYSHSAGSEW